MSAPYRPGQPQWHDNRPQRPDRPPPIQFRQEEPPPPPGNKVLQWSLRAAGLVAVAVVSGLVWYYITNDDQPASSGNEDPPAQQSEGVYRFEPHEGTPKPDTDEDCAKHAYGNIQEFFQGNPCDHLSRQLFVTVLDDGRTIYTSVSVVTMPDEAKAAELREFTDEDGSGNINDVVRDGLVEIDGLDRLSKRDGYASSQSGQDVIIIEGDFDPKGKSGGEDADEKILDAVCEDALRLGPKVDTRSGSN